MIVEIKNKIDRFFDQERELWQVEDFVLSVRRQISFFVPKQINLLNGSVDYVKGVVNRLDQFLDLREYLNQKIFKYFQDNQEIA